jgi:hypothetical protein
MHMLKRIGVDWPERRLISKLCMEQSVKIRLDQGKTRSVKLEEELDKVAICRRFCSTYTASTLPRKLLKGLETSKQQVICTVKYADDLVLLAREEKVLQGMFDRLIEIGRRYGM